MDALTSAVGRNASAGVYAKVRRELLWSDDAPRQAPPWIYRRPHRRIAPAAGGSLPHYAVALLLLAGAAAACWSVPRRLGSATFRQIAARLRWPSRAMPAHPSPAVGPIGSPRPKRPRQLLLRRRRVRPEPPEAAAAASAARATRQHFKIFSWPTVFPATNISLGKRCAS